ncbi:DUF4381 domain-containing protein [Pandoraea norimbergensis]|uniref:DUF4381 domain-containing protein n=1 Tax=Pandoraea norimbergensis TaxID=93219 RepID=A0ABN4JNQ7_9BURK|nr:DUF4381 domain-containing protein [Pandoraea norimbergensis]ALS61767.1 hypothetical protein AT302_20295 [Pandoraea norimbergensis]
MSTSAPVGDGIQELALPPQVPYTPQTWGWAAFAVCLFVVLLAVLWRKWRRYRRNRYRRAALAELDALGARMASTTVPAQRRESLAALAVLLKRTALAAYPAAHVGTLQGDQWIAFLNQTKGNFDGASGQILTLACYAPQSATGALAQSDIDTLVHHAAQWIRDHHVET